MPRKQLHPRPHGTPGTSSAFPAMLLRTLRENHNYISSISTSSSPVLDICPAQYVVCGDSHMTSSLLRIVWRMFSSRRLAMMHDIAAAKAIGISTTLSYITSQIRGQTRRNQYAYPLDEKQDHVRDVGGEQPTRSMS